jgi:hypothetical protein
MSHPSVPLIRRDTVELEPWKMSEEPLVLTIPEAGWKFYRLKRDAAYAAARAGRIPVISIGGAKRVPVRAIEEQFRRMTEAALKK